MPRAARCSAQARAAGRAGRARDGPALPSTRDDRRLFFRRPFVRRLLVAGVWARVHCAPAHGAPWRRSLGQALASRRRAHLRRGRSSKIRSRQRDAAASRLSSPRKRTIVAFNSSAGVLHVGRREGAAALAGLPEPAGEAHLDWFHVTMRITVLRQFAKGLIQLDEQIGGDIDHTLERMKWYLWHGKGDRCPRSVGRCPGSDVKLAPQPAPASGSSGPS